MKNWLRLPKAESDHVSQEEKSIWYSRVEALAASGVPGMPAILIRGDELEVHDASVMTLQEIVDESSEGAQEMLLRRILLALFEVLDQMATRKIYFGTLTLKDIGLNVSGDLVLLKWDAEYHVRSKYRLLESLSSCAHLLATLATGVEDNYISDALKRGDGSWIELGATVSKGFAEFVTALGSGSLYFASYGEALRVARSMFGACNGARWNSFDAIPLEKNAETISLCHSDDSFGSGIRLIMVPNGGKEVPLVVLNDSSMQTYPVGKMHLSEVVSGEPGRSVTSLSQVAIPAFGAHELLVGTKAGKVFSFDVGKVFDDSNGLVPATQRWAYAGWSTEEAPSESVVDLTASVGIGSVPGDDGGEIIIQTTGVCYPSSVVLVHRNMGDSLIKAQPFLQYQASAFTSICFMNEGDFYLAVGYRNGQVSLFDRNGKLLKSWKHQGEIMQLEKRGQLLLSASSDGTLSLFCCGTDKVIQELYVGLGLTAVQLTNVGSNISIVCGFRNGSIALFSSSGDLLASACVQGAGITDLAVSNEGYVGVLDDAGDLSVVEFKC